MAIWDNKSLWRKGCTEGHLRTVYNQKSLILAFNLEKAEIDGVDVEDERISKVGDASASLLEVGSSLNA